jgi:hypothetical protein
VTVTLTVEAPEGGSDVVELVLEPGREPEPVVVAGRELRLTRVDPVPRVGVETDRSELRALVEARGPGTP